MVVSKFVFRKVQQQLRCITVKLRNSEKMADEYKKFNLI